MPAWARRRRRRTRVLRFASSRAGRARRASAGRGATAAASTSRQSGASWRSAASASRSTLGTTRRARREAVGEPCQVKVDHGPRPRPARVGGPTRTRRGASRCSAPPSPRPACTSSRTTCPDAPASDVADHAAAQLRQRADERDEAGRVADDEQSPRATRFPSGVRALQGTGRPCRPARAPGERAGHPARARRGTRASRWRGAELPATRRGVRDDALLLRVGWVGGLPVRHLKQGRGKPPASGASAGASHEISACSKVRQCTAYGMARQRCRAPRPAAQRRRHRISFASRHTRCADGLRRRHPAVRATARRASGATRGVGGAAAARRSRTGRASRRARRRGRP